MDWQEGAGRAFGMGGLRLRGVWICGTDTGVGKTVVATGLVRALSAMGFQVVGLKPVVTGSVQLVPGRGGGASAAVEPLWEDLERHRLAAGVGLGAKERAVYRFHAPAAPSFAAAEEGVVIDRDALLLGLRSAFSGSGAEFAVIEGVGGFRVPLCEGFDSADLVGWFGLPVVLVVGMRLGCINHALLTAEAMVARGVRLAGWVANFGVDSEYLHREESVALLEQGLGLPCSARLERYLDGGELSLNRDFAAWELAVNGQIERAGEALAGLAGSLMGGMTTAVRGLTLGT